VRASQRRLIRLKEWQRTELELTASELAELQSIGAEIVIQPLGGSRYVAQPGSIIGSASTPGLRVLIEPKFAIDRLFYLLGEARRVRFLRAATELGEQTELTEGFIAVFLGMVQRRLRGGLLKNYVRVEEEMHGVRGRIRTADQIRRHFALPLPMSVAYDDYTEDIPENRLLKAALRRLAALHLEATNLRRRITEALGAMSLVSDVEYRRATIPRPRYTRLTEPYRPLLELAELILQNTAIELREGERAVTGLLFDMNKIFEDFLFESLRRRLYRDLGPRDSWVQGRAITLDEGGSLRPEPDLSWWRDGRCLFVGDAKYKHTAEGRLADLYQLLAYCSATGLGEGLLVYAEQTGGPSEHRVRHDGPLLRVEGIDLAGPVPAIEGRCDEIATEVRRASVDALAIRYV
jgi:5-methylcytosine-specific restriction enzyme subunit McrC